MDLKSQHSSLVRDVTQFLSDKNVSCNDIVSFIMSLPTEHTGEQYTYVLRHTADMASSNQLIKKLHSYMHFTDFRLLKELIIHFAKGSHQELLGEVERYEADMGDYCQRTTVASFSNYQQDEEKVPEFFTTLEVKSTLDPNQCNLQDIDKLRRTLGEEFGQCLRSQLVKCAMIFFKVELSSASVTTITLLIPSDIAPGLVAAMTEPTIGKFLDSRRVTEIAIDGRCFYMPGQNQMLSLESNSYEEESIPPTTAKTTPPESK